MNVTVKTPAEQDKMRAAGRLAASVLDMIEPYVQPGVTTDELDKLAAVHDHHAVARLSDHPQVMADDQHAHPESLAQIGERFIFEVKSGPSLPRTSVSSPSQRSAARKYGRQSSHDQPRLPSCAQWSKSSGWPRT